MGGGRAKHVDEIVCMRAWNLYKVIFHTSTRRTNSHAKELRIPTNYYVAWLARFTFQTRSFTRRLCATQKITSSRPTFHGNRERENIPNNPNIHIAMRREAMPLHWIRHYFYYSTHDTIASNLNSNKQTTDRISHILYTVRFCYKEKSNEEKLI